LVTDRMLQMFVRKKPRTRGAPAPVDPPKTPGVPEAGR
jgi:hypothetical protein